MPIVQATALFTGIATSSTYVTTLTIPLQRISGHGHTVLLKGIGVLGSGSPDLPDTFRFRFLLDDGAQTLTNFPLQDHIAFRSKLQGTNLYHNWFTNYHIGNLPVGSTAIQMEIWLSHASAAVLTLPSELSVQLEIHEPYI
jgi:hypothetical protein